MGRQRRLDSLKPIVPACIRDNMRPRESCRVALWNAFNLVALNAVQHWSRLEK